METKTSSPFFDLVPKDAVENLRWRIRCRERALTDKRFRDVLWQACMQDLCFWMSFATFGYDPRARVKIVPFIPYPHQQDVFVRMDEAVDKSEREETSVDVILDKARAQGGTFGYLWVDLRRWLRDPMFSAGFVTRNEDLIDSKSDSSTVLWKVAWAIERLPFWMKPNYERHLGHHTFINHDNGALMRGYSAGQDVAAGGRCTVFTVDEAGARDFVAGGKDEAVQESIQDVSNCVRLVSARYVDAGVFHNACENPDTAKNGVHLVLDWKDHPAQSKHSYIVREGVAVAIKPEDQAAVNEYHKAHPDLRSRLERKGFKYEGVVRSPWYDSRCLRPAATPRLIASQLDRNPRGAVGKVFASDLLDRMKHQHCKRPVWVGNPVFDSETCKLTGLIPREDGSLKLWFRPGVDNSPPLGPFTAGADIASGGTSAYASNSVFTALDERTGEQAAEYTIKGLEPRPFARRCVGLCMWLRNAQLGWEDSGVSGGYAKEVMEVLYYGNVFFRNVTQLGSQKKSRKPGWPCQDPDKADMFEQFALAMENGKFIPRSEEMIVECSEYEWDGAKIIHVPTKNKGLTDKNHADRCLIAGTMILTDKGEVPIEDVNIGDLVWTRKGLRPVILSGLTGVEDVIEVTLSNGRTLIGTGNHPVWTENRSWVNLQSLRPDDILIPCQTQQQMQSVEEFTSAPLTPKQWCSMGENTIVAQILSDDICGCIIGADQSTAMDLQSHYTLSFGRITTDLCQMVVSFITKMRTLLTMTFPISNVLLGRSMERFITTVATLGVRPFSMPISANIVGKSTRASGSEQPSFAAKHVGKIIWKREYALFAKLILRQKLDEQHRRVQQSAQSSRELGSTVTFASSAVNNTKHREGQRQVFAARNADRVYVLKIEKRDSQQEVYNLSVAETPEYFAQGILVHNCISAAGCWLVFNTDSAGDKIDSSEETGQTAEYGSFAWREEQERRQIKTSSPKYGLRDIIGRW